MRISHPRKHSRNLFGSVLIGFFLIFSCSQAEAADSTPLPARPGTPAGPDSRQLWKGTFHQTAPIPWDGPLELYLRYESEARPPQRVDGVLTWPTLGMARVKVVGERQADGSYELRETECLDGDCSQVVLGGRHHLTEIKNKFQLSGRAEGQMGLQGNYVLEEKQ